MGLGMFKRLNQIFASEFNKSILVFFSGGAIAQIINLIGSPFLTRLYNPEIFGRLALLMSITSILNTITTFRYENVILLSKNYSEFINSFILCSWINISVFILGLFIGIITMFFDFCDSLFIIFLIFSLLFSGFYTIFLTLNTRKGNFKLITKAKIFRALTTAILSIGFFYFFKSEGLLIGFIMGQFVECVVMGRKTKISLILKQKIFSRFYVNVIDTAKQNIDYPKYTIVSTIINRLNTEMPILLIGKMFGSVLLGQYSLAYRVISPFFIISASFSEVFKKFIVDDIKKNSNSKLLLKKTTIKLSLLSLISCIIILILSFFFLNIFGPNWDIAAKVTKYFVPYLFFAIIVSPISVILLLRKKLKWISLVQIFHMIMIIIVFGVSFLFKINYYYTICLLVMVSVIKYIVEFIISFKISKL